MRFDICVKCREFVNLDFHECKRYKCWHGEDQENYGITIFGVNSEDAAQKYAMSYNEGSGEYHMMNGDPLLVTVEDYETEAQSCFEVEAYPAIDYSVKRIS